MRYKEVSIEYNGRKTRVVIHTEGIETEEEMNLKAIEMLDRIYSCEQVRRHIFGEDKS